MISTTSFTPSINACPPAVYDFRAAPPLRLSELNAVRKVAKSAAHGLSMVAEEYLQSEIDVQCRQVLTSWQAGRDWKRDSIWAVAEGQDSVHQPVWRFDASLWQAVTRLMVGQRMNLDKIPDRPGATRIEMRLLGLLCEELFTGWSTVWPLKTLVPSGWRCIEDEEQVAGPAPGNWVLLSHLVTCGGSTGRLDLFLPLTLVRLPLVVAVDEPENKTVISATSGVSNALVTVQVQLAKWQGTVKKLAQIKAGDLLQLAARSSEPVTVCVAGQPKFLASVGTQQGLVALKIIRRLPETDE